jgi:signal transduction histidine kinase/CheY-like chemotaxis protein
LKSIINLLALLALFSSSYAQNTDSLALLIKNSNNDSIRLKAYAEMTEVCELNEIPFYARKLFKISGTKLRTFPLSDSTKYFYLKNTALALNNLGFYYENIGENKKAFKYLRQALSLYQLINDLKGIGVVYSNLGSVYDNMGDLREAIDYYFQSLRIREALKENIGIANNLHNIASLYNRQGEFENAYTYSERSLAIRKKINDKGGIAASYAILAQLCAQKGDTSCAINYLYKTADFYTGLNESIYSARSKTALAGIYKLRQQYDSARINYLKVLSIYLKQGENLSAISMLNNLSDIELATHNLKKALLYAQRSYSLSIESANVGGLIESSKRLKILYASAKNYEAAYKMFRVYNNLSDSMQTNSNRNTLLLSNIQYQYQKKALADSLRMDEDLEVSALKLREEQNVKIFAILLFLISAVFLIYLFRRFKLIQKQNIIIEKQKIEVETQKKLADSRLEISESQKLLIQDSLLQLEKTQEKLLQSKLEAEKANASKSTFIANVSHEIRTPLNAVLGFSELLKGSTISPKHEKYIDHILTGGKNLLLLVNDILDISKMEAGHLVFYETPVSLQSIIDDCNEWVSIKADEKGLEYRLICDEKFLNIQLLIDELRIRQIVFNLLGNAIKFTNNGSVQLSILPENTHSTDLIDLTFIVKDTGPGIPADQHQSVFEAFKQINGQANREFGGTGLGLTITKHLVERLNGTIQLTSVLGEGTTFTVKLKDVKIMADSFNKGIAAGLSKFDFDGQSILLVEDTLLNKELFLNILQAYRLSVHFASNGKEALSFLQSAIPDLILMDLMMPVMDGFEATREIKKDSTLKDIPVIALTALSYTEIDRLQINNFDGYIQKPIHVDDLIQLLAKFLQKKES